MFILIERNEIMNKIVDKPITNRDQQILDGAIEAFRVATGIVISTITPVTGSDRTPSEVCLSLPLADREMFFRAVVMQDVSEARAGYIAHQFQTKADRCLLVTSYIAPNVAKKLKTLGIAFIDTAGNAYIEEPPLIVYLVGNKRTEKHAVTERAWNRAGMQVVFALLCKPELISAPFREIADAAGVALGSVSNVLLHLTQKGLVAEDKSNRYIASNRTLFEKWVAAYGVVLRPKTFIASYRSDLTDLLTSSNLSKHGAMWGGEVAAGKLTGYLKPEIVTIYVQEPINKLILDLKLSKDPLGKIELRERFWKFSQADDQQSLVPEILIYADLLATGESRNLETAKRIYDEYIVRHLG